MLTTRAGLVLLLLLAVLLTSIGCTCGADLTIPTKRPLLVCRPHASLRTPAPPIAPGVKTVAAGTIPHTFSVTPHPKSC